MRDKDPHESPEGPPQSDPGLQTPRHGFRGESAAEPAPGIPAALSITVSREAGARGGTIGRRVGRKLGWQVYDQEVLEYIAQEATVRQEVLDNQGPAGRAWAEPRLDQLQREEGLSRQPGAVNLARVILALGAGGQVVLIGRGAGCLLPPASTLKVRILAPLGDRIAYMSDWLRLTREEAAERVRLRDSRRAEFLQSHYHHEPGDVYKYDLVLNSSLLGEELCADLIVQAARAKEALLQDRRAGGK
jgi:cytidylate kinase